MAITRIDAIPVPYVAGSSQVLAKELGPLQNTVRTSSSGSGSMDISDVKGPDHQGHGNTGDTNDSHGLNPLGTDRFVTDELESIQMSVSTNNLFLPQVANQEPAQLYRGLIRYCKSPWDPIGTSYEGLVSYDGSAWTRIGLDYDSAIATIEADILTNAGAITSLGTSKADASHTHAYGDITGVTTDSLVGRDTAGTGVAELITLGTNLSMASNVLNAASGSKIVKNWGPADASFPATNNATLDTRNTHPVLDFDTATQETVYFHGVMPDNYDGEGITVQTWWTVDTVTSGTIGWDVSLELLTGLDIDGDSFATAQAITATTVSATNGTMQTTSVSIADGTAMDSLVAGSLFRLRVRRDVANDTAAGDAELHMIEMRIQ